MKLLLLDLDDTLVDDHSAVRAAFSAFVAFHAPALRERWIR
jgi:FMN phosphatase YigB (HAD superfamily)